MADYIYLLETRLSKEQTAAISALRTIARNHELTVFMVGGAIRDLISGAPVRDLDLVVQGNALKLKKDIEKAGGEISAEVTGMQAVHARFPSGVRMEIASAVTTSYPKPGRVVAHAAAILDDLRRRDFTANAMALSLNEGSYGLLMDPLNGVADIENRELRLVSNYGFLEDPARLIRAARLMARLGWRLDERSQARYETAKEQNYIAALQPADRAYETEELFHEEDPVRVMRRLEEEGWLVHLNPVLGVSKANLPELARLRDVQMRLQEQGVIADASAANFPLLTAKLATRDALSVRESFPRRAFVREIDSLDGAAKSFAAQLLAKGAALPSQSYRIIMSAPPAVVLWTAYTTRNATLQAKFESFYTEWPQSRQRIPHLLMQEMRISSDLPRYGELMETLSYTLMDGNLETPEAMRAFLEPYSPPAPPPPVSLRRQRAAKAVKKEVRPAKVKKAAELAGDLAPLDGTSAGVVAGEVSPSAGSVPPGLAEASRASKLPAVAAKQKKRPAEAVAGTAPELKAPKPAARASKTGGSARAAVSKTGVSARQPSVTPKKPSKAPEVRTTPRAAAGKKSKAEIRPTASKKQQSSQAKKKIKPKSASTKPKFAARAIATKAPTKHPAPRKPATNASSKKTSSSRKVESRPTARPAKSKSLRVAGKR